MELAPEPAQRRILGRYAFLYGDALEVWASRWRNQMAREPATAKRARQAKGAVDELRKATVALADVRDHLSAKRQPSRASRADDVEATLALWRSVRHENVVALALAGEAVYEALDSSPSSLIEAFQLPQTFAGEFARALPAREGSHWHVAADTGAELRAYTLPVAQGGPIGRMVAQANDVIRSLELVLSCLEPVRRHLPYALLIRSALVLEVATLLELLFGPELGRRRFMPLIDLCRYFRAPTGYEQLTALRETLLDSPAALRWVRNRAVAHVDDWLPLSHLYDHLILLDLPGLVGLAEHVLDWLDAIACNERPLRLLALGEQSISSWPVDPSGPPVPSRPTTPFLPGAVSSMLRRWDSPHMISTGSAYGSAVVAGLTVNRARNPRVPVRHGYARPPPLEGAAATVDWAAVLRQRNSPP